MKLSERQRKIVAYLKEFIVENGYPPTIRQIGEAVDISSTSVVNYNLKILEKAGYIDRDSSVSRGIKLTSKSGRLPGAAGIVSVPMLGRIAAGVPIPVPEDTVDYDEMIELAQDLVPTGQEVYALEVRGDSMIDALINDGDVVIMKYQRSADDGDMVAAWLKDEEATTLKRFHHEGKRIRLQPENKQMQAIYVAPDNIEIQGKVVAVIRHVN
jgi:repressor LexA